MSDPTTILDTIIREIDAGRRAALCVIVATRGSTPQYPGAMLCVNEDAQIVGTLGGGSTEADIRRRAHELLSGGWHGQAKRRHVPSSGTKHAHASASMAPGMAPGGVFTFELDHDVGTGDGLICGGQMDVAISVISRPDEAQALREAADRVRAGNAATLPVLVGTGEGVVEYRVRIEATPKLVIAGGGHIGRALAAVMVPLGFHVSVIDDRSDFANTERFPPPIEPTAGDITETLKSRPIDANTYIVIVTRGHKHDERALGAVLDSPAKYIGMIGSKRKIKTIYDNLTRDGAAQEHLDRVHAPIGVDIGAVTPEEIAVSIAAQLVAVRRAGQQRESVTGPFPVPDLGVV